MIKLETLLEKHPDDVDSTSGVIIEHADTILIMKKSDCSGKMSPKKTTFWQKITNFFFGSTASKKIKLIFYVNSKKKK